MAHIGYYLVSQANISVCVFFSSKRGYLLSQTLATGERVVLNSRVSAGRIGEFQGSDVLLDRSWSFAVGRSLDVGGERSRKRRVRKIDRGILWRCF